MVQIFFGSQTGNAQNLAHVIGTSLDDQGIACEVLDMGQTDPDILLESKVALLVSSTYGDGEPPDTASEWMSFLKFSDDLDLSHLKFAVIGLGDSYYPHFCQSGKDFHEYLSKWGAHAMCERLDCDRYYEEQYEDWLPRFVNVLLNEL